MAATHSSSVEQTIGAINAACRARGGAFAEYSCQRVSWDDVQRGTVGGGLSCWGANITDTRLWAKDGRSLYTVRSQNWNEKLGKVSAGEVAVVVGNHVPGGDASAALRPVTLRELLANLGTYGGYAGLPQCADLSDPKLDAEVSVRFQTTFLPVGEEQLAALEFATEAYNYSTRSDTDPRNLVLLCTSQGLAVQQDGQGAKKLFHHAVDEKAKIHRYWLEAERTRHLVGGPQQETAEERAEAQARGKATASVIGIRQLGTRFNVLMTIQVPLKQQAPQPRCGWGGGGGMMLGAGGGSMFKKKSKGFAGLGWKCGGLLTPMSLGAVDGCEESDEEEFAMLEAFAAPRSRSLASSGPARRSVGKACAARVSRGSEVDVWPGLTVKAPVRHEAEHLTCTIVIYNAVAGGVPSEEDVVRAVEDLEQLYTSCSDAQGRLADPEFDFMKAELTVKDAMEITAKLEQQPYKPPGQPVQGFDEFPTELAAAPAR